MPGRGAAGPARDAVNAAGEERAPGHGRAPPHREPSAHPVAGRRRIAWLASYPKSGNTWTRLLLANVASGKDVPANRLPGTLQGKQSSSREQFDDLAGVESSLCTDDEVDTLRPGVCRAGAEQAARDGARLFCKAHDALHDTPAGEPLFPEEVTVGAVYLMRNPLDVAVSWAFHFGHGDFSRTIAKMNDPHYENPASGCHLRERLLDWSGHVESWTTAPFPVLVVRYEDLLADTFGQLARMVRFLGLDGAPDERQRLQRAVESADFARLREDEERDGFRESPPRARRFFRSGRSGDWRRYLTAAQAREVVRAHGRVMSACGYPMLPPGRPD